MILWIQVLRAIAVIAVIVFHFNEDLLPGGFRGVDLFFVISGFVITRSIYLSVKKNSFSIANPTGYDNPWQDYNGQLEYWQKDRALERYRRRWFFNEKPMPYGVMDIFRYIIGDFRRVTMRMTPEELATIFHFPAGFGQSTALERSDIKKTQPPTNLPT